MFDCVMRRVILVLCLLPCGCLTTAMWDGHQVVRDELEVEIAATVTEVSVTAERELVLGIEGGPARWPDGQEGAASSFLVLADGPSPTRTLEVLESAGGVPPRLRLTLVEEGLRIESSRVGHDPSALLRPDLPFAEMFRYQVRSERPAGTVLDLGGEPLSLDQVVWEGDVQVWSTAWRALATPVTLALDVTLVGAIILFDAWLDDDDG